MPEPHGRFDGGLRGYVLVTLDRERLRVGCRTLSRASSPGGTFPAAASLVTRAGRLGLR